MRMSSKSAAVVGSFGIAMEQAQKGQKLGRFVVALIYQMPHGSWDPF